MRYFFHIGYNGFAYQGWQKLPQANSIQAVIETQLSRVLKTEVAIIGCGRTDAQVHASQFFFHLDIEKEPDYDLKFRLNKNLPPDIAIFDVIPMKGKEHSRLDAVERTYNYFIHTYSDPFLSTLSSLYTEKNLDLDEMKKAVAILPNHRDYRNFCRKAAERRTTICNIKSANLYTDKNGDHIRFEISANRFLNGMIRMIVERLLMIGRRELTVSEFESILNTKDPVETIKSAYPQGLYLSKVRYPFLDIPSRSHLFNSLVSQFQ
ncbi:MAG TPA: tRNA pseudouridine(38-40) synthase TruA [Cyclobacteriaceae bacterium]